MKEKRQKKILEIIAERVVETQEELARLLEEEGFVVTQATISRDIKELNLRKVPSSNGGSGYRGSVSEGAPPMLKDAILHIESAENLLIIQTVSGMAMAVAANVDSMKIPNVVGTIAGDDTIFCAIKKKEHVGDVMARMEGWIQGS